MVRLRKNKTLYLGIVGLILFFGWAILVKNGCVAFLDESLGTIFKRNVILTNIMRFFTIFGEGWFLTLVGILVTIFIKDKKYGASTLINLGLIAGINSFLKVCFKRPRPAIEHLVQETGFSFPSGHSSSSMAFYGYLIYLIYKKCKNPMLRNISISLLAILVFLVGISRVYLGVHYPSDVIGGYLLALSFILLYVNFTNKFLDKE